MSLPDTDNDTTRKSGFVTPGTANRQMNKALYTKWRVQQQLREQLKLAMATEDLLETMLRSVSNAEFAPQELNEAVWNHRIELGPLAVAHGFCISEHETRKDLGMLHIAWSDNDESIFD